jgi:pentapeptide MXKDX repeat protein
MSCGQTRSSTVRNVWQILAVVALAVGLGVAVVGCGSSPTTPPGKMDGDKMGTDKMHTDKMGTDKMSGDKMSGDKMGTDKMATDKMEKK